MPVNSMETVEPQCAPGYFDFSQGKAYYWSCAFYCEGGKYYATAGCQCACLTHLQAAKLLEAATRPTADPTAQPTAQPTAEPSAGTTEEGATTAPGVSDGTILPTSPPVAATTQQAIVVITTFPVGEMGAGPQAPSVNDNPPPASAPTPPGSEEVPETPARTRVENVAMVGGAALGGLCVLGLLLAGGFGFRKREPRRDMPAITLYKPSDAAPSPAEPTFELTVAGRGSSSRASSKSSTGSQRALITDGPGSRRNSRESAGSLRSAGKATDAEALATASTNASNFSGVGSVNSSWAWGQNLQNDGTGSNHLGSRHLSPQRPRASSKCSTSSKPSRVEPEIVGERRERRASDSSNVSIRELEVPSWRRPTK